MMTSELPDPVAGPRWSRKRLVTMLIDCYGPTEHGGVDVNAIAEHAGVTAGTVRRWIAGGPGADRKIAPIPADRLRQLQRGPDIVERHTIQQYQYALTAIEGITAQREPLDSWIKQGWLDEHTVAIVDIHGKPWHQVVVTKTGNQRAMSELTRRATIVSTIDVPTKFHGQVLAHAVMARQQAWRVTPAPHRLSTGRTNVWMADAPAVDLNALDRR